MDHWLKKWQNKNFLKTEDSRHIQQKELDKVCFQHDMAYESFKDLNRRTATDKALHDKAFNTVKNLKYDGYQRGLALMVYNIFDEETSGGTFKN